MIRHLLETIFRFQATVYLLIFFVTEVIRNVPKQMESK